MDTALAFLKELSANKSVILVVALLMGAWWEWRYPVRIPTYGIGSRWVCNASLHFINTIIGAWLTPLIGAGLALIASRYTIGFVS
jgi:hypothetical protein